MDKIETIEDFYKRKFDWMPDNIRDEIGHFNVFRLAPFVEGQPINIPYRRRDFYKIMFVKGNSQVHFADQVVEIKKQALSFSAVIKHHIKNNPHETSPDLSGRVP